jgi:hypothetical protein
MSKKNNQVDDGVDQGPNQQQQQQQGNGSTKPKAASRPRAVKFPEKLHQLLEAATATAASIDNTTGIEWHPSGDSFLITNLEGLCSSDLFKQFFPHQSKPRSFERILLSWGFSRWPYQDDSSRISRLGQADSIPFRFGHAQFRRGQLPQLRAIQRVQSNSTTTSSSANNSTASSNDDDNNNDKPTKRKRQKKQKRPLPSSWTARETTPEQLAQQQAQAGRIVSINVIMSRYTGTSSTEDNQGHRNNAVTNRTMETLISGGFGTSVVQEHSSGNNNQEEASTATTTGQFDPPPAAVQEDGEESRQNWHRYPRSYREYPPPPFGGSDGGLCRR